jgi:hypothetical protein
MNIAIPVFFWFVFAYPHIGMYIPFANVLTEFFSVTDKILLDLMVCTQYEYFCLLFGEFICIMITVPSDSFLPFYFTFFLILSYVIFLSFSHLPLA